MVKLLADYYIVGAVVVAMLIAGVLDLLGFTTIGNWLLAIFSVVMAIKLAWGMVQTLREGRLGIDILAVTAIISTVAVGQYWASIVIVLMLTGGEALEDYANQRATRELTDLLARAPTLAHLRKKDGSFKDIPITAVKVGDILVVKPNETVPVDCILQSGIEDFDESSLTGESLPVEHKTGDELLSGSINGSQAVNVKAIRTAHDSQYQQIIDLVEGAATAQAPFVRLADRYAVPFTLISFAIAGVAWATSGNPLRFAEVLVVATPCPLLIGAPVAMISGMSRQAKHGIIVKNGATLEKLARIQTVAFDKTGTLTHGEPALQQLLPIEGVDDEELLQVAASAERQSTHVLAQALQVAAKIRNLKILPAKDVNETTAQGVEAILNGHKVVVGKIGFLRSVGIDVQKASTGSGETAVYVARDGELMGSISFTDKIRDNSKQTLQELANLGIKHTLMLTGDAKATAERIAYELGLEDIKAECLPKDKVEAMIAITHRPVMMVGDGINDAPVLAAADVGLAMGARGSTAASETANVVVLLDDISRVALAVKIAKNTIRIALQSVWIGIIISVGLMLVATSGLIPAVVGAGLQEIVDIVVIFNALRAHGSWVKQPAS